MKTVMRVYFLLAVSMLFVSLQAQIKAGDQVMIFSHDVNIRKIEQLFK